MVQTALYPIQAGDMIHMQQAGLNYGHGLMGLQFITRMVTSTWMMGRQYLAGDRNMMGGLEMVYKSSNPPRGK